MVKKYLIMFLISMVPIVELRGAIPYAAVFGIPTLRALIICMPGNILPVPVIFWFARRVLMWGKDKKIYRKIFYMVYSEGWKRRTEAAWEDRRWSLYRTDAVCRNPTSGYRSLDGYSGSQFLRSWLEEERTCRYGWCCTCRPDRGSCKLWTAWRDRSIILMLQII